MLLRASGEIVIHMCTCQYSNENQFRLIVKRTSRSIALIVCFVCSVCRPEAAVSVSGWETVRDELEETKNVSGNAIVAAYGKGR